MFVGGDCVAPKFTQNLSKPPPLPPPKHTNSRCCFVFSQLLGAIKGDLNEKNVPPPPPPKKTPPKKKNSNP